MRSCINCTSSSIGKICGKEQYKTLCFPSKDFSNEERLRWIKAIPRLTVVIVDSMKNPYDKKPELSTFADVDRLSYENLCADASSHAFCAPIISFVSGELFMDAVDRIHLRNTIVSLKGIQGFYFPGFPCRSPLLHYDLFKKQDNKNRQVVTT